MGTGNPVPDNPMTGRRDWGTQVGMTPTLQPNVWVQKMTKQDDPEASRNGFERTSTAAGWWGVVLIPCLIGPAQQDMDNLTTADLADCKRVKAAILQTLNLRKL